MVIQLLRRCKLRSASSIVGNTAQLKFRTSRAALALVLVLLSAVASLLAPLAFLELVNTVLAPSISQRRLHEIAALLVVLIGARVGLGAVGAYAMRALGERTLADLRIWVYSHLQDLGVSFFQRTRIGELISTLASDLAAISAAATDAVRITVLESVRLVGAVVLMLSLNWRLGLAVVTVMPAAAGASRLLGKRVRVLAKRVQDMLGECNAIAQEVLGAMRLVQLFARGAYEVRRYAYAVERLFGASLSAARASAAMSGSIDVIFGFAVVTIFWFGGVQVIEGRLNAGELVAFLFYAEFVSGSVSELTRQHAAFSVAAGAAERVTALVRVTSDVVEVADTKPLHIVFGKVQLDEVHCAYERRKIVRGVTLIVEPGDVVAIVGPSGAGKSTLLNLVPRMLDPTSGRVLIDDIDVRMVSLRALREQIAVVPQEVHLFGGTVFENIRYGRPDATDEEVERAAKVACVHEFVAELRQGFDTPLGEGGSRLSGGQRQRIAIARALVKGSRILLLDEATSAVDPATEALVMQGIRRLEIPPTTLVAAHSPGVVRSADRVVVLEKGRIVSEGQHEKLLAESELYSSLMASGC